MRWISVKKYLNYFLKFFFSCVNFEDVEQMLNTIRERKNCPIFDTIVPSNKEEYGTF